eukprot:6486655-Lingulodinium_polyedra.AAC.1
MPAASNAKEARGRAVGVPAQIEFGAIGQLLSVSVGFVAQSAGVADQQHPDEGGHECIWAGD